MVESWMIQVRLEEEEKKRLMDFYKGEAIAVSSRVLKLIREDVEKLQEASK